MKRVTRPAGDPHGPIPIPNVEQAIVDAYYHKKRVKVRDKWGGVRHGVVSRSTGPQPVFLLVHRRNQIGSWDVLGRHDTVIAVQFDGKNYTYI